MIAILLAAALAAAEPAAAAAEAAQPAAPAPHEVSPAVAPSAAADDGNKLVCWYEAPSGTHQRKRICAKQRELDAMKRNAVEFMTHRPQDPRTPLGR